MCKGNLHTKILASIRTLLSLFNLQTTTSEAQLASVMYKVLPINYVEKTA